jgi:hypothetical protein
VARPLRGGAVHHTGQRCRAHPITRRPRPPRPARGS